MFLSPQSTGLPELEERIVLKLLDGPVKSAVLVSEIHMQGDSRQGIYKALRKLKRAEVVLGHKKILSLNMAWLQKVARFSQIAQHTYSGDEINTGSVSNLAVGEKAVYSFKNLKFTDAFWNHTLYILLQIVPDTEDWYAYDPHMWFFLARTQEEYALLEQITASRNYLLTVGSDSPMDIETIKYIKENPKAQFAFLSEEIFPKNYYLNILGDYLIEVSLGTSQTEKLEEWYKNNQDPETASIQKLNEIIEADSRVRLTVSRNPKKAERIRKRLRRLFT